MLSPASGWIEHGLTLDAGLREAVEEGFFAEEAGLIVPTLEGGLEPARREAGLEDVPSTALEVGFAFEVGFVTLDAGLVALDAGLVAFEAGLGALEAGLVFWETSKSRMPKGCRLVCTFFAGGSLSSASSAFLFLPRDLGGAAASSPAGFSSSSILAFLERGLVEAFLGAGSGSAFGCSLMRAERRGATSASAGTEVDLGLATMIIEGEGRGKREGWSFAAAVNALWTECHVTMLIVFRFDLRPKFP